MEDKEGRLWFSGNGGVYKYDPVAEAAGKKPFYDVSNALKMEGVVVNNIIEDSEGIIWVATENFVCRYDPDAEEGSSEKLRQFSTEDGIGKQLCFFLYRRSKREYMVWDKRRNIKIFKSRRHLFEYYQRTGPE